MIRHSTLKFILLFCNVFLLFGFASGKGIIDDYNTYQLAIDECGNCLIEVVRGADTYEVDKLEEKLLSIDWENVRKEKQRTAYGLLGMLIQIKLHEIEQLRIEYRAPPWYEDKPYSNFQSHIDNLFRWQKRFESKGRLWDEIQSLDEDAKLAILLMSGGTQKTILDRSWFEDKIWVLVSDNLAKRIEDAENFLFDKLVPDKSMFQLEYFLSFAVYDPVRFEANRNIEKAFEEFFIRYTADGEKSTLDGFSSLVKNKNLPVWTELFRRLEQTRLYEESRQIATLADQVVNVSEINPYELSSFIEKAAPRYIAFVAFQKLCREYLEAEKYDVVLELIKTYKGFFVNKRLYASTGKAFENFESALKKLAKENSAVYFEVLPMESINTPKNNIRFVFSQRSNYLAALPNNPQDREYRIFERRNNKWEFLEAKKANTQTNVFSFINHPRDDREKELIGKERSFLYNYNDIKPEFKDVVNLDHQVSHRHKVAFFVSGTDYQRRDQNFLNLREDNEYLSPWNVDDKVSLQFYSSSIGFHGRVRGNMNTDIYYAMLNDDGETYGRPISMGNLVNSPFAERSPFLSEDGNILYFSSEGHGGLGGFDVFSVPIRIESNKIKVTGPVRHVLEASSPSDELYYQKIFEGSINEETYLSSNRKDPFNFDIYRLEKRYKNSGSIKPELPREQELSPIPDPIKFLPDWPKEKLILELECDTFENVYLNTPPGKIRVRGRVYDSKGRPIKRGRISFAHINNQGTSYEIEEGEAGKYNVLLTEGVRYQITITATTIDSEEVDEYLNKFVKVCDQSLDINAFAHQDQQTIEIKKLREKEGDTGFDFFFDTNRFVSFINNKSLYDDYWSEQIRQLETNKAVKLLLEGYADERGAVEYNFLLAKNRVETVAKYLTTAGFSEDRLILKVIGETDKWDSQSDEDLRVIMPPYVFDLPLQQKNWLKNRRVRVRFQ